MFTTDYRLTAEYQYPGINCNLVGGGHQPSAKVLELHGFMQLKSGPVAAVTCAVERIDGTIFEAYKLMPLDQIQVVAA